LAVKEKTLMDRQHEQMRDEEISREYSKALRGYGF